MDEKTRQHLELLASARGGDRKKAAKALRKVGDAGAADAMLQALKEEVDRILTGSCGRFNPWEVVYHLATGLGEIGHRPSATFLREMSVQEFESTIIYLATGDALMRLDRQSDADVGVALGFIAEIESEGVDVRRMWLLDGSLRAMAVTKMMPAEEDMRRIVAFVSEYPNKHEMPIDLDLRIWPAAAAPTWDKPFMDGFLDDILATAPEGKHVRKVAEAAKAGKYKKWPYL